VVVHAFARARQERRWFSHHHRFVVGDRDVFGVVLELCGSDHLSQRSTQTREHLSRNRSQPSPSNP